MTPAKNGVRGKDSTSYPRLSTHRHGARTALLITVDPIDQRYAVTEDLAVGGPSLWPRAIIFPPAVPSHALHVFQPRKFRCSGQEPPRPILLRRPKSIDRVRKESRSGNTAGIQPRGSERARSRLDTGCSADIARHGDAPGRRRSGTRSRAEHAGQPRWNARRCRDLGCLPIRHRSAVGRAANLPLS